MKNKNIKQNNTSVFIVSFGYSADSEWIGDAPIGVFDNVDKAKSCVVNIIPKGEWREWNNCDGYFGVLETEDTRCEVREFKLNTITTC